MQGRMEEQMRQQQQQQQGYTPQQPTPQKPKERAGDYIDFEEVGGLNPIDIGSVQHTAEQHR